MSFDQGKLEKMTLRAYLPQGSPDEPPKVSDAPEDTYMVQVNPSASSFDHLLRYSEQQGQGASGSDAVYSRSEPTTMQFEFLFDGTGAVPPADGSGRPPEVLDEIAKLKRVVYDLDGDLHRPRKVLLVWGTLDFACVLSSLSCRFTLFKPDGSPLRAIASCAFREWRSDAQRAREDNLQSPDLTHVREVTEGDTLPLLAHQVYGNAALYLEVARVNKLVDFRRLRAGTRVTLPPVDKEARR